MALKEDSWCPSMCSLSVFNLLTQIGNLGDYFEMFWMNGRDNHADKRVLMGMSAVDAIFMNEDDISSERQWRRAPCISGFLYVGMPDRPLPGFFLAHALPEERVRTRAKCFFSHFSAGGRQTSGMLECSVQVPGKFPVFSRLAGADFALRFVQANPEHGSNMAWQAAQVFYEDIAEDIPRIRELAGDVDEHLEEESEFTTDFSDFDEEEHATHDLGVRGTNGCGHGIRVPRFFLPEFRGDEDEARLAVQDSPLKGLSPGQAGVAAQTWRQLAGVATAQPDIKWLGRVVYGPWCEPSRQYWNDFRIIHAGETTNLQDKGHRLRFGEKCMKYGSIDICVRALSVWPAGERVGYHGVLDLFAEVRCIRSFEHYWPKISFILQAENYAKWVQPHTNVSRQEAANSILALCSGRFDVRDSGVKEVVAKCRVTLAAEPTVDGGICRELTSSTVWDSLFGAFANRGREGLQCYDLMLRHGPQLSQEARGGEAEARTLRLQWDRSRGLEDTGGHMQRPWESFVQRCEDMNAFTPEGLEELRSGCS